MFANINMAKSTLNKGKRAFTFVEVILVMALISFLYVVTTKVIQHNIEKKVPTYVYYLYKNLENESKVLTKKIIDDAENGTNTALKEKLATLNSNSSKMQAILETMDGKKYGEYLVKDINTLGAINYDSGTSEVTTSSEQYKNIEITNTNNMSRSFEYTVNDDGSININYKPARNAESMNAEDKACKNLKTLKSSWGCHYTPTNTNITNLITPQNEKQWYKVVSVANAVKEGGVASTLTATVYGDGSQTNPDIEITTSNTITNIPNSLKDNDNKTTLNIDTYEFSKKSPLFTSNNNIKFHIVTSKAQNQQGTVTINRNYNYTLNYSQDAICPLIQEYYPNNINVSASDMYSSVPNITSGKKKNTTTNACYINEYVSMAACRTVNNTPRLTNTITNQNNITKNCYSVLLNAYYCAAMHKSNGYYWKEQYKYVTHDISNICVSLNNNPSCNDFLVYINDATDKLNTSYKPDNFKLTIEIPNNAAHQESTRGNSYNIILQNKATLSLNNEQTMNVYLTKWNNFFKNIGKTGTERQTIAALSGSNTNEGSETNTITFKYPQNLTTESKYLNHFIYASIDTPFSKGKIGKNIFAFEQFGDKIIPVGFLANNANSPLKFDVITRNPKTFKIEKVNYYNGTEKRPLTFCEAMAYTGDKFSQYCGCKDESGNIVAQFEKNAACNNVFGCIIRPVKPSS